MAIYVGIGALVFAWIRLGRAVRSEGTDPGIVRIAIAAWVAPLLLAPPLFSRDLYSYLAQGALAVAGLDPYSVGVRALPGTLTDNVAWMWLDTRSPYGPLFLALAKSVVAVAGQNVILGALLTRLVVIVTGLVLLCAALPALCRHLGAKPSLALVGRRIHSIIVQVVGGVHNDMLMIGLLTVGTLLVLDGKHVLGFTVVASAMAVKASAVIALPFLLWVWVAHLRTPRRHAAVRFAMAAGAGTAVVTVVFGLWTALAGGDLGWLPALADSSVVITWLSVPTGCAELLASILGQFTEVDEPLLIDSARTMGWTLLVAAVCWLWWISRAGGAQAVRGAAGAMLLTTLLSAVTYPWYFSWPLAAAASMAWPAGRLAVTAGASVWLALVSYPTGETALYDWGYVAVTFALAVVAAFALVRPVRRSDGHLQQRRVRVSH